MALTRAQKDRLIQNFFLLTATSCIVILFLIMIFLFEKGSPTFKFVSVSDFLFT